MLATKNYATLNNRKSP